MFVIRKSHQEPFEEHELDREVNMLCNDVRGILEKRDLTFKGNLFEYVKLLVFKAKELGFTSTFDVRQFTILSFFFGEYFETKEFLKIVETLSPRDNRKMLVVVQSYPWHRQVRRLQKHDANYRL
jgi:hypothetical protein